MRLAARSLAGSAVRAADRLGVFLLKRLAVFMAVASFTAFILGIADVTGRIALIVSAGMGLIGVVLHEAAEAASRLS